MLDNKIEEKWPLTEVEKYNSQGSFLIYTLMVYIDLAALFRLRMPSSWPGSFFIFRLCRKPLVAPALIGKNNQPHQLAQQDYYTTQASI